MYRVDQILSLPSWSSWAQGADTEENEQKREYTDRLTAVVRVVMLAQASARLVSFVWYGKWLRAAAPIAFILSVAMIPGRLALCRVSEVFVFVVLPVSQILVRAGILMPEPV